MNSRVARARVSRKKVRYVLIMPCWELLVVVIRGILSEAVALGPVFSSQVKSIIWLAIVWPRVRLSLGSSRWMIVGKKPSMLEKWWGISFGVGLNCLLVKDASSSAKRRPRMVTMRAASFRSGGMVMTGVFRGVMFEVIKRPAIILPQARRLMGLITVGLFSLMGESVLNRGWPMDTKKTTRRL